MPLENRLKEHRARLGINQADMIVNIIRHVAVCLDANYVAGFVLCRVVNHFNELLRLAGALGAHNQSNQTISLLSFIWGVLRCLYRAARRACISL